MLAPVKFTIADATIVIDTDHSTAFSRLEWKGNISNGEVTVTYRSGGTYTYGPRVTLDDMMPLMIAADEARSLGSTLYGIVGHLKGERVA